MNYEHLKIQEVTMATVFIRGINHFEIDIDIKYQYNQTIFRYIKGYIRFDCLCSNGTVAFLKLHLWLLFTNSSIQMFLHMTQNLTQDLHPNGNHLQYKYCANQTTFFSQNVAQKWSKGPGKSYLWFFINYSTPLNWTMKFGFFWGVQ